MSLKNLALISTSIVALGISATVGQAAPTTGVIYVGFAEWWDDYHYTSDSFSYDHPSLYGFGRVNIPYADTKANLQLDFFGDASLHSDRSSQSRIGALGNLGVGLHLNERDPSEGLLGLFVATGRVWDVYGGNSSPVIMAGFEGQYYCGPWTLYGQAGYMDSNPYFMENAGFVRGLLSYYVTPRVKLTGGVGYIGGQFNHEYDANAVTWQADAQYWFGKSVPIAFTLKYEGREAEIHYSSPSVPKLNSNEVSIGFSVYFGGGSIQDADRTAAGTEIPNFDWFRLPSD